MTLHQIIDFIGLVLFLAAVCVVVVVAVITCPMWLAAYLVWFKNREGL